MGSRLGESRGCTQSLASTPRELSGTDQSEIRRHQHAAQKGLFKSDQSATPSGTGRIQQETMGGSVCPALCDLMAITDIEEVKRPRRSIMSNRAPLCH